jgi:SAM-dependent methyltransferase
MTPLCLACGSDECQEIEAVDVAETVRSYGISSTSDVQRLAQAAAEKCPTYLVLCCRSCRLEYAHPSTSPGAEWYSDLYSLMPLYPEGRWEHAIVLSTLTSSSRVIELGCGSGEFLARCRSRGVRATGFDFSAFAVRASRAAGYDAYILEFGPRGDVPEYAASDVMAFHTVEHLSDPLTLFRFAGRMAAPHGTLWLSVPSQCRPSRCFRENDPLDTPPHHLTRWTADAMREVAMRSGWRLKQVLYEPLPFRTALWSIATRSRLYRQVGVAGWPSPLERGVRWLLYPWAAVRRVTTWSHMSGFSMLAVFERQAAS